MAVVEASATKCQLDGICSTEEFCTWISDGLAQNDKFAWDSTLQNVPEEMKTSVEHKLQDSIETVDAVDVACTVCYIHSYCSDCIRHMWL